jgi:hypothetical protein
VPQTASPKRIVDAALHLVCKDPHVCVIYRDIVQADDGRVTTGDLVDLHRILGPQAPI